MTEHAQNRVIAVIGGGAAGLMAAAAAGHAGCRILLFDRNDRLGRKIYATGNGRCNLTNRAMSDDYYNVDIMDRLHPFDSEALERYFRSLGVYLHDRGGYIYPRTDQAATIAEALIRELRSCKDISVHLSERVTSIAKRDPLPGRTTHYQLTTSAGQYDVDCIILATGGMVSKAYGCTGDGYTLARALGHTVTTLSPALVPVYVTDPFIKVAAGVRCAARVTAMVDGEIVAADTGELQITESGLSGIPVFQVSRWISQALAAGQEAQIDVDYLPEFTTTMLREEIVRRQNDRTLTYVGDVFAGLVHRKIGSHIARRAGLADEKKLCNLENPDKAIEVLMQQLRCSTYIVNGTADYDKAQVTAGGVAFDEVDDAFGSRKAGGVYLTGELLDVDGMCGGYNLTFAMCSGYIAGLHAAAECDCQ